MHIWGLAHLYLWTMHNVIYLGMFNCIYYKWGGGGKRGFKNSVIYPVFSTLEATPLLFLFHSQFMLFSANIKCMTFFTLFRIASKSFCSSFVLILVRWCTGTGFHSQNFCAIFSERNAKFFFLCAKKLQFAQSFAKVISRKIALFRFCETQVLRNSPISKKSNG